MSQPVGSSSGRPALRSKLAVSLDALLAGDEPWHPSPTSSNPSSAPSPIRRPSASGKSAAAPRARWYADLLCLPCDSALVREALGAVSASTLLAPEGSRGARVRENIGALWREAGRAWREEDEVRAGNAVEMLFAISSSILAKRFPQYASDVILILAGGMDEADLEFSLLVAAIDEALRQPLSHSGGAAGAAPRSEASSILTPALQRRVLQLALVWVSHVGPTPLAAYFAARRDLWSTVSSLLARSFGDVSLACEAAQLLGLLSALGPSGPASTAHAYARRMRDWRDGASMGLLRDAAASALGEAMRRYVERMDDAPPSIVSVLAGAASLRWIAEAVPGAGAAAKERERSSRELAGGDFADLPPPEVAILLSLFLFARSNPIFVGRLLERSALDAQDGSGAKLDPAQTFPVAFLSLSSYLAVHGSSTTTSRAYARLTLLLLTTLLSDGDGARALLAERPDEARAVRVCRQKPPPLPVPSTKRARLVSPVIDTATLFLRHNLSRRLDTTGHLLSLRLIRAAIQCCSDANVRLEHDWIETWRAVLALASFVASRHGDMRGSDSEELVRAIMATLGLALARSDEYLASPKAAHELTYEIVRCGHTLRRLVQLLVPEPHAASGSSGTRSPLASPPISRSASATSPRLGSEPTFLPLPPRIYASVPGWRTTERVIAAVEGKVDEWAEKRKNSGYFGFGRGGGGAAASTTGDSTPTSTSTSGRNSPAVQADAATILKLIASIDAETLLAGAERSMDAGAGGAAAGSGAADGDAWLDSTADACLAESLRLAGEDVRAQILGTPRQ